MLKAAFRNVSLAALAAAALPVNPVLATSPDRSWLGVERLVVLAELRPSLGSEFSRDEFCARVKRAAARQAPFPVQCAEPGDSRLQAPDVAVLLVQAAVQPGQGAEQLLVFAARRERQHGLEPAPILFGSAPRAVPITNAADRAALEGALGASLSEVLPWLRPAETSELSPSKRERMRD